MKGFKDLSKQEIENLSTDDFVNILKVSLAAGPMQIYQFPNKSTPIGNDLFLLSNTSAGNITNNVSLQQFFTNYINPLISASYLKISSNLSDVNNISSSAANIGVANSYIDFNTNGNQVVAIPLPRKIGIGMTSGSNTIQFPDATTLNINNKGSRYYIQNYGSVAVTFLDGSGGVLQSIPSGTSWEYSPEDISSVAGVWRFYPITSTVNGVNGNVIVDLNSAYAQTSGQNLTISSGLNLLSGNLNIGGPSTSNNALTSATSITQGISPVRMTTAQKNAIPVTPFDVGLEVYVTDETDGYYYFNGATWVYEGSGGGGGSLQNAYDIGNTIALSTGRSVIISNQGAAQNFAVYSTSTTSLNYDSIEGIQFTTSSAGFISALQYINANFSSGARQVGVYRVSDQALLVSDLVYKTDPLDSTGNYRTHAINPIPLSAGTTYIIIAVVPANENWAFYAMPGPSPFSYTGVTFNQASSVLVYPTTITTSPDSVFGNASLQFSTTSGSSNFNDNGDLILSNGSSNVINLSPLSANAFNSKLSITGTNSSSTLGPSIGLFTDADSYPVMQILGFNHTVGGINFNCYSAGGTFKSSSTVANFSIQQNSTQLQFLYQSGISQGTGFGFSQAGNMDTSGNLNWSGKIIVGASSISNNALAQINSTTRGFLPPNLSSANQSTLVGLLGSSDTALQWFNSTTLTNNYWDGSQVQQTLTFENVTAGDNIYFTYPGGAGSGKIEINSTGGGSAPTAAFASWAIQSNAITTSAQTFFTPIAVAPDGSNFYPITSSDFNLQTAMVSGIYTIVSTYTGATTQSFVVDTNLGIANGGSINQTYLVNLSVLEVGGTVVETDAQMRLAFPLVSQNLPESLSGIVELNTGDSIILQIQSPGSGNCIVSFINFKVTNIAGSIANTNALPQGSNNLFLSQNGGTTYQNINGTLTVGNLVKSNTTGGQLTDSGIVASSVLTSASTTNNLPQGSTNLYASTNGGTTFSSVRYPVTPGNLAIYNSANGDVWDQGYPASLLITSVMSMGGDLSGTLPNPIVSNINTVPVASSTVSNGQLLIGSTSGSNYTAATLTGTANQIIVTNGSHSITLSLPQSIATSSSPQFAGLNLSGLTASKAVVTDGSNNLSSANLPLGINTIVTVSSSTQSMSLQTRYVNNYTSGLCVYTLPAATGSGKIIELISLTTASTSGWIVNATSSGKISFGSALGGANGSLTSTAGSATDCATLIDAASNLWVVYPALGSNLVVA